MRHLLTCATVAIGLAASSVAAATERHATSIGDVEVTRVADGLDTPWSVAFLPDGSLLVTERPGRLNLIAGGTSRTVAGVPQVRARGQGGLLDVAAARDFPETGEIFLTYAEPREGGTAGTALAVARLDTVTASLHDLRVIFRQAGPTASGQHFGSRVVEAPDGTLFLTVGDRGTRDEAQLLSSHNGSVLRVARDGSIPADNPFTGRDGARPEIWSYGHRNPQGAALGLDGALWTVEHGPRGGDEVNLTAGGRNYGWPVQSFGREYRANRPVGQQAPLEGVTPPLWHWQVSPAVSGLAVYSGALFPEWQGDLFTGALQHDTIIRLEGGAGGVTEAERLFDGVYPRIRDVREAPDGSIWFISEGDGAVYRIKPTP